MHEAYHIYPAKTKFAVQIESMAAYNNRVILGTRQGHLMMYSVVTKEDEQEAELDLLQYDKNFSKKPIVQLAIVPEEELLFSLSDSMINVHQIVDRGFSLIQSSFNTKGTSIFCLEVNNSTSDTHGKIVVVRVCTVIKRKLQFWYWKANGLCEIPTSINLYDIPKALCLSQNVICVGYKSEYVLYDVSENSEKEDSFLTSSSKPMDPCICLISDDIFAVVKDEYVLAIDANTLKNKKTKPNDQKSLKPQNDVAVKPVESEKRKLFKPINWHQPVQVLEWDEPYIIGVVPSGMEVHSMQPCSTTQETLIQTFPKLHKVHLLARSGKGYLFAASINELWYIQLVDIPKQRQSLLQQKNFKLALQLTELSSESETEKKEKIHQIQTHLAFDLFAKKQFSEAMQLFVTLRTDPYDVIRLFPDLLPNDNDNPVNQCALMFDKLSDKDLENGLLALIEYLREVRLQGLDTKSYSKQNTLLSIIDTTLLKCYLQTNDSFVAPLLRLNRCHLEESEKTLIKHQKLVELIILYQTKGQHKRALELLRIQAEIPGSSLHGYDRIIKYLQQLGPEHKQLVFEYADWVLKKQPEEGLKIFTEVFDVENLPRAEILDYLLTDQKNLVIPYLEHIIYIWDEPKPLFHNILIQQYREKILQLTAEVEKEGNVESQKKVVLENTRSNLVQFLEKSTKYNSETVLADFPRTVLLEERAIILGKLGKHEKVLAIYVQVLWNIEKAAKYCESVYPKEKDIFSLLIKTIISPPSTPPYDGVKLHPNCSTSNIDVVLDLLNKYALKFNPVQVLSYLPDDIRLIELKNFLETVLRNQLENKRQNQVLIGLLSAEDLQMEEQRMKHETKSISITEFSACPVCKKRFTKQSAFVYYPNGEIVHFLCQDKKTTTSWR